MKYSGACLWREARAKQAPPAANSHSLGAFCVLMREWHLRASATRPPPTAANVINSDDGATTNFQHGAAKAFNPFATRKSGVCNRARRLSPAGCLLSVQTENGHEAQIAKANKLPLVLGRALAKIKPQHAASQGLEKIFRTPFLMRFLSPGWFQN